MKIAPYIATFTGGKAYPLGLDPSDVKIEDIAHSLSQQCRYAGHTSHFWSVAAHSLEVSARVERAYVRRHGPVDPDPTGIKQIALTALLHDAGEAYLQDIVRPLKPLLQGYAAWEENVEFAVAERFGLVFPFPTIVKEIDNAMVLLEVAQFFPPGSAAWTRYGITERKHGLIPLSPVEAETAFLLRFEELANV